MWFLQLFRNDSAICNQPAPASDRQVRLHVEPLEDRCLLSTNIFEFNTLPTANSAPAFTTLGPDENIWFTEQNSDRIGRINRNNGLTEFFAGINGDQPRGITTGPDGNVWFVQSTGPGNTGRIGRITTNGVITEFTAGITAGSILEDITVGPDGNLWFTVPIGSRIGRITTAGVITEFSIGITPNSQPAGITAGPDGNLYFTQFGSAGNRIARISVGGGVTQFNQLPTANSGPLRIVTGPDGNLWFTEQNSNRIGRINTAGTILSEFNIATPNAQPADIVAAPDGNLWFTMFNANRIGQISTAGVFLAEYFLPTPNSQPLGIEVGPHSDLVFAEFNNNRVGLVREIIDDNEAFIQALYRDVLIRTATQAEVDFWTDAIVRGGTRTVVDEIENSEEGLSRTVDRMYFEFLNRLPTTNERNTFVGQLQAGSTGEQIIAQILATAEYFNLAPTISGQGGPPTNEKFVRALYAQLLNRTASQGEINFWVGRVQAVGRLAVATGFLETVEYRGIIVSTFYTDLLRRPNAPAQSEINFWVNTGLDLLTIRAEIESTFEYYIFG